MSSIMMSGFDDLEKMLEEARRAADSLEGEIGTIQIEPNNPEAAISEMERLVDAKLSRYRKNPIVEQVAETAKKKYREQILKWAEEAKRRSR